MKIRNAVIAAAVSLAWAVLPAQAGLWDDLKEAVGDAGEMVDDVKGTREEAKDTVGEAKEIVDDTSEDVGAAMPEREAAPPPPPSAKRPPPPSARVWHLDEGNGKTREVSQGELVQMIRAGSVGPDTFVYGGALADWTAAGEVEALAGYFAN
ncbi:MAG: DUF4339 domain-containing protein [Myxococcota bacterium]